MNPTEHPLAWWWPLATSAQLGRSRPLARVLHGHPLVLFRDARGEPVALPDRCPHRLAPLSAGRVCDGAIQCPYHGWRFDADGHCLHTPGSRAERSASPLLQPLLGHEAHGLIWLRDARYPEPAEPCAPAHQAVGLDVFWMHEQVSCSLQQAAENFLDAFHTHFVHAGWIRRDARRQPVVAEVRALADGVEARYSAEAGQSGVISRLLERSRGDSFGRFRLPGLAEIEYRDQDGRLSLLISAWLVPTQAGQLQVSARIATRRGFLPGWLKQALLRPLFAVVLGQDKRILEAVSANHRRFAEGAEHWGPSGTLDARQDLLGPWIRQLLATGRLSEPVGRRQTLAL